MYTIPADDPTGRGWSPDILFPTATDISYLHVGHNFHSNDQIELPPPPTYIGPNNIYRRLRNKPKKKRPKQYTSIVYYFLPCVYKIPFCSKFFRP